MFANPSAKRRLGAGIGATVAHERDHARGDAGDYGCDRGRIVAIAQEADVLRRHVQERARVEVVAFERAVQQVSGAHAEVEEHDQRERAVAQPALQTRASGVFAWRDHARDHEQRGYDGDVPNEAHVVAERDVDLHPMQRVQRERAE